MVLSHKDIEKYIESKDILIEPFSGEFEPASYDLRVGKVAATQDGRIDIEKKKYISIPRGAIVVIKPLEKIELSRKIVARFGLRSKFARKGLVLLSGPQIKPDWRGTLSITIFNAGSSSVTLQYGEPFAEIEFSKLDSEAEKEYGGIHQDQSEQIEDDELELATKEYSNLMDLDKRQRKIEMHQDVFMNFIYLVVFAVIAGILISVARIVLPSDMNVILSAQTIVIIFIFAIIVGFFLLFKKR